MGVPTVDVCLGKSWPHNCTHEALPASYAPCLDTPASDNLYDAYLKEMRVPVERPLAVEALLVNQGGGVERAAACCRSRRAPTCAVAARAMFAPRRFRSDLGTTLNRPKNAL